MRLEKIVLNGFKSFADKTELAFDSPITAIVGPNGCGKSNVVDAVKWVLGEQSVKSLRSGHMADVIFGGSSSRKALGAADVSLFISNTAGQLPIEADQVQITRRIYKSGESEYRINNKACRLKDIRELFMDTGVATKAYSIIEQGQVEQLITASKADRRVLFEEAAGVSKYKAHKKEALRKLDRTEQNLLRLADILGEVQKQLRSVKYQAGKARNYLQYAERLKELQSNYSLAEYHKINSARLEKKTELGQLEQEFAAIVAEVAMNDSLMSNLGHQIVETENEINSADNCLVSVQSKIDQHLQRIEFLQARISELQQRKGNEEQRIERLSEAAKQLENDLKQCIEEQQRRQESLVEKRSAAEQLEETIKQVNAKCSELEADLRDEKSGIIDIVRRTAQLHNEVRSISVHRNTLSSQKDRLWDRANTTEDELKELLTHKAQYNARLGDIEKLLDELQQNLDSKRQKTEELAAMIAEDNDRLAHCKETRSAMATELSVLRDMETKREGLNNAVKTILQDKSAENGKFSYVEAILAEVIVADVEYAKAVEAALEGQTDALVVSSFEDLVADMEVIKNLDGRVNCICTDRIKPFSDSMDLSKLSSVNGRLVEFVKYDSKYAPLVWDLLGKVVVVDSINEAFELAGELGDEYGFVTLKGEFLHAGGSVRVGPLGKATGLISRKSRLRQLEEMIDGIVEQIAAIEQQIANSIGENEHLAKLCKDLRTAVYEANTEKMQVGSKFSVIEQNVERLRQEQPLIAGEIDLLEEQISQSVQKEYESKQKLEELETVNNQRTTRIEELETAYADKRAQQQSLTAEMTELKVSLGQTAEQSRSIKQTIANLQDQIQSNLSTVEAAQAEADGCVEQSKQAQRDILSCETAVSELYVEREHSQQCSQSLHRKVEELLEQQKQTEQLVRQKRAEQAEADQKMNELKVELGQLEVRNQNLLERVQEELQIDLVECYEKYKDGQEEIDWDAVREEMAGLRSKIERLGHVNVDAINEQEDLEKRNEFLSNQVEDLNSGRAQLQQLIGRLNTQSREKFATTFEEIRVHFQQIFRKLFGGGKADILIEESEDILEAGIEIIARPPGKETRSISLLSGGEKSLTAIALLFAVFKTKPSPFCFLDEVDAALDEANNERFNMLIREFQKDSQFIIITHSKRTMSIADVLYGITMQTRGVSKKISVRFGDVEEENAAVA